MCMSIECLFLYVVAILRQWICLTTSSKALVASAGEPLPPSASCKQLGAFSFPWLLASSNLIAIDSRCSAYATNWASHSPRNLEWTRNPIQMFWKHSSAAVPWHFCYCASSLTLLKNEVDSDQHFPPCFVQLIEEKSCMPKTVIDTVHTLNKNPEKSGDTKSGSCLVVPFIPNGFGNAE